MTCRTSCCLYALLETAKHQVDGSHFSLDVEARTFHLQLVLLKKSVYRTRVAMLHKCENGVFP